MIPKQLAPLLIALAGAGEGTKAYLEAAESVALCAWFARAVGIRAVYPYPANEYLDQYAEAAIGPERDRWGVLFAGALLRGMIVKQGETTT